MKENTANTGPDHRASNKRSKWKEILIFFATISGFLSLLASATIFSISKGIEIWKEVTWNDSIKILKLESAEGYLFINDGDGEIYLNDVSYFDENTKKIKVDFINSSVPPGKFLEFRPKRQDLDGYVPLMAHPDGWNQVYYAVNKSFPGLSVEYSLPNSQFLKIIERSAHENPDHLVKSNGVATIHYHGSKGNTLLTEEVKVVGVVWKHKSLRSIPDKKGIDEKSNK